MSERRDAISMALYVGPVAGVADEGYATASVDIMSVVGAPGDELLRIKVHADGLTAATRDLALGLFGLACHLSNVSGSSSASIMISTMRG